MKTVRPAKTLRPVDCMVGERHRELDRHATMNDSYLHLLMKRMVEVTTTSGVEVRVGERVGSERAPPA